VGGAAAAGVDVLHDDRDERTGVKFKDSDLIGIRSGSPSGSAA
jgi:prolyl-tRNA synthetase